MRTNVAALEVEALDELRKNFEAEGYSFILNPAADVLPDFLHDDRPDAIAFGPNENVVVEVKSRRSRASAILLELMAKKVSSQPGWRLLVVYTGESSEVLELSRADQHQIDQALHEIRSLMRVGPNRVLLVAVWSVFEVLARNLYPDGDPGATKPLSPIHVVERLASDGYLNIEEARRLRTLISTRNRAAHGDLTVDVADDEIQFMLGKAEEINNISSHLVESSV